MSEFIWLGLEEKQRCTMGTRSMKRNGTENRKINLTAEREQKECEETFLRVVLSNEEAEDSDYWLKKARELAQDPNRAPTPEQRAAFEKRLSQEVKKIQSQKRRDTGNHAGSIAGPRCAVRARHTPRRLAVAAVFLSAIMTTTLYCTVDAFAAGVDNFISTIFPRAQELRLKDKKDGGIEFDHAEFAGMYVPDWFPEEYTIVDVDGSDFPKRVLYSNMDGNEICFYIYKNASSLNIDDEEVIAEKVFIHDSWGRMIAKGDDLQIIWEDGEYLYMVYGNQMIKSDLIQMIQKSIRISTEE